MSDRRVTIYPSPYMASVAMERDLDAAGVVLHRPHMAMPDLLARLGWLVGFQIASPLTLRLALERALVTDDDDARARTFARRIAPAVLKLFLALDLAPARHQTARLLEGDFWSGEKKRLLAPAWTRWRELLAQQNAHTEGDVLRAVISDPGRLRPEAFAAADEWRFCGFRRLSPLHMDMLIVLADTLPARVVLELPLWTERDGLYGPVLAMEAYLKLHAQNSRLEIESIDPPFSADETRRLLAANLFTVRGESEAEPVSAPDARVRILRPANEDAQFSHLVKRLHEWIDAGVALNEIAVIAPDLESLRPYLRRAINEGGLPLAYHRSEPVLNAACFRWLHALADSLTDSGSLDALTRLARQLDHMGLLSAEVTLPLLLDAQAHLNAQGVETLTRGDWQALCRRDAENGDGYIQAITAMLALRDEWQTMRPARDWLARLTEMVARMRLPSFLARDDARHFSLSWHAQQTVQRILTEWRLAADHTDDRTSSGLSFLHGFIDTIDIPLKVRSSPEPESIAVLSIAEAAQRRFLRVIVLDMLQERFPGSGQGLDLLRETERLRVNAACGSQVIEGPGDRYQHERMTFLDLLLFSEKIEFWAVATNDNGEETEISPFMIDLARHIDSEPLSSLRDISTPAAWRAAALTRARVAEGVDEDESIPSDWRAILERSYEKCAIEDRRAAFMSVTDSDEREPLADAYTGVLNADGLAHGGVRLPERFGTHWFDGYAACPFRLLMERLLRVSASQQESLNIEPRLTGTAMHETLGRLVQDLVGAQSLDAEEIETKAQSLMLNFFTHQPELKYMPAAQLEREAHQWAVRIRQTIEKDREEWSLASPRYFEQEFGNGDARLVPELRLDTGKSGPFWLTGRMDRVDIGANGACVVDYKGTRNPSSLSAKLGRQFGVSDFQMPIYLLALAAARRDGSLKTEGRTLAARYLAVGDPEGRKKQIQREFSLDDARHDAYLSQSAESTDEREPEDPTPLAVTLGAMVDRMRAGRFDVSPREGACEHCSYNDICRVGDEPADYADEVLPL